MERPCIQENGKQFVFKEGEKMREKIEMVDLQPEQKERTLNCMTKLYQSLEFFYQLVNDDKLSEENVRGL